MGLRLSGEPRRLSEDVLLVLRSTIRLLDWLMMLGRMVTSLVRVVSSWLGLLLTLKSTGSTCTEVAADEAIAPLLTVEAAAVADLGTVLKGTDPFLLLAPEALKIGVIVTECCMMLSVSKQIFQVILTQQYE